jgi:2-oxoglutarate ferredoxin oxidoreductase subunit alpha
VAEIEPGGYLMYDSSKPLPMLPAGKFRDDIHMLGVPLTDLCATRYTDPRERQLLKNIVYVGVLAAMLGIEPEVIATLLGEQYKGKAKLIQPNLDAFMMGLHHGSEYFDDALGLKIERRDAVGKRIFIEGNAATALGCVYGGATVCAWYPITPSSSVAEAFQKYCGRLRVDKATGRNKFAIVQAEDEIASIGIVTGAGWNGARAFTCTSGPGVSLMTEFIGLAYFAEIPVTIIDVQRGGPSTGMPTRTQQADILSCAYASHGDTKHVLLFPEDPKECFEFAAKCLDLADRLQTPIFLMTDLDIGMNHRLCDPLEWNDAVPMDRGKVMTAAELDAGRDFGRYLDVDGDGIPYRTLPGTHPDKGAYFTRGTTRDAYARYSEAGPDYLYNAQRLLTKFETAKELVPGPIRRDAAKPTKFGVIHFGSTSPAMNEAYDVLQAQGVHVDVLRVRAFPFSTALDQFIAAHETVFVVEQNRDAQLRTLIVTEHEINPAKLEPILHYDGTPITARFITEAIAKHLRAHNVEPIKKGQAA